MGFEDIIDVMLPLWLNVIIVSANIINLIYNIPQIYRTFKRKSTRDISGTFLVLRLIGNSLVLIYTIYIADVQLSIANIVTVLASIFLCSYKISDILEDRRIKLKIRNDEGQNRNVMSIDTLIIQLQAIAQNKTNQNVVIEDMKIDKRIYKILYLRSPLDFDYENANDGSLKLEDNSDLEMQELKMQELEMQELETKNLI